jgi:ferredoxin
MASSCIEEAIVVKVWIDQDLCTGDGLCAEIAPDVFFGQDDGLFYVKESAKNFGTDKLLDGKSNPAGSAGMARIPDGGLDRVIEAAEECPGECIFIEVE